jgi:hypothetical protein
MTNKKIAKAVNDSAMNTERFNISPAEHVMALYK